MVSTTTFGDFPGVQVTTTGGAVTGLVIGREEKLVVIGVGDEGTGNASVNDAVQVNSRLDADDKFGSDTDLTNNVRDAIANGANLDYLYGIMVDVLSQTGETITGGSGTLGNAPLVEDASTISITNTTQSQQEDPVFRYEEPLDTSSLGSDEVAINPHTGDVDAGDTDDYQFDYEYPDWSSALDEAETVVDSEESGILSTLAESESIASDLSTRVNGLRPDYKMVVGLQGAEPNSTSNGDASYDTSSYSDNVDNDAMYLHAPARRDGSTSVITGAIGGRMAGNDLDDSIFNQKLDTDDISQSLSNSERDDLRDEEVIPIEQPSSGGDVLIADNLSTSTETDWERDYWRVRIVDQVVLIAKTVGESILGRINDSETRETVATQINTEIRGLADDRLLQPNTEDEENWFVDVYEVDSDTVGIDIAITPYGIAKRIETTITVDA